jgi:predicted phage tail protein
MTNVFLEGRLGDVVGQEFTFKARNVKEVLSAIEANTGKLRNYLFSNKKRLFAIFVEGKEAGLFTSVKGKVVRILPILFGSVATISAMIAAKLVKGAVAKAVVGFIVGAVLSAVLSFGISMLISKMLKPDDPDTVSTSSFIFGQAENVANQGVPVPVGYGRLKIGSRIISVNTFSVDKHLFDSKYFDVLVQSNNSNLAQLPNTANPIANSNDGILQTKNVGWTWSP